MADSHHKVPVEERLFSVVLALLATENGLTKNDILRSVQGYRQRYAADSDNASLERQFERDKDDLRELGIPVETFGDPDDPGNNHALRYRIPKHAYTIPGDIRFTAEEMTLLALAAAVWRRGSLSAQSQRALTKLRGIGAEPIEPLLGIAPHLTAGDPAFEPLSRALERHTVVRFAYLKPGEQAPRRRVVAPYALVQHQGRWHLYGHDRTAGAVRTFLLARIAGAVTVTAEGFTPPDGDQARAVLAELERLWHTQQAVVTVTAGTEAALQLARRADDPAASSGTGVLLHYTDLNAFADELAGYGPEVVVTAPDALREAVVQRLRRVSTGHAGPASPRPGRRMPAGTGRSPAVRARRPQDTLVFLLALIPYLLEHPQIGVADAAAHFGVPAEHIRQAVRLIAVSGVPGPTRQYLPGDLFDISWDAFEQDDRIILTHLVAIDEAPRFSAREAAALIAGLQYLQPWIAGAGRRSAVTLMAKLAGTSSGGPSPVAVDTAGQGDRIGLLRTAIADAHQVAFDYLTATGDHGRRTVDPLRLDSVDQTWYLRAWCHDRHAVRTFRLDRMTRLSLTERPTVFRPGQITVPERLFDNAETDFRIDIEVEDGYLPMIADYLDTQTPLERVGTLTRAHVRVAHVHGIKRLTARLGGHACVVGPPEARRAVASWAQSALAGYGGAAGPGTPAAS